MFRKVILNIHMYGGLLCFSYLLLIGISTLNFNHRFSFTIRPASVRTWTQPMTLPGLVTPEAANHDVAAIVHQNNPMVIHALGSFGTFTYADGVWTDSDTYHARFVRPGKEYQVDVHPSRGRATITRTRANVWAMIRDMHGLYAVYPDSLLASSFKWYTEISAIVVLFACISGVYLWTARRRERRLGLIMLGAAGVVSLSLMVLITTYG